MKARGRNPSTQKVYKNEPPRAKDREKEKQTKAITKSQSEGVFGHPNIQMYR